MNSETLFEAFTTINDDLIAEASVPPKSRTPQWLRITAVAACLAVVITGAVLCIPKQSTMAPFVSEPTPSSPPVSINTVIPLTPENEAYPIVYPPEGDRVPAPRFRSPIFFSYPRPNIGDCVLHPEIYSGIHTQENPNTIYWLQILLFSDKVQTPITVRAEAQRLADAGYEIYVRNGGIFGYFTKDHLEHFCGISDYGYSLIFAEESADQCERLYPQV